MLDLLRRQASDISPSDGKQLWGMQLCLFMKEFMISMALRKREERIVAIEAKIAKKKEEISILEAQKENLLHPVTMKSVLTKAKEAGLSPKEVAAKLGLDV